MACSGLSFTSQKHQSSYWLAHCFSGQLWDRCELWAYQQRHRQPRLIPLLLWFPSFDVSRAASSWSNPPQEAEQKAVMVWGGCFHVEDLTAPVSFETKHKHCPLKSMLPTKLQSVPDSTDPAQLSHTLSTLYEQAAKHSTNWALLSSQSCRSSWWKMGFPGFPRERKRVLLSPFPGSD